MRSHPQDWTAFYENKSPMPTGWNSSLKPEDEVNTLLREAVIVRLIKPEQTDLSARKIIEKVFPQDIVSERPIQLQHIVHHEIDETVPSLLISSPGFDPSQKVESLAKSLSKEIASIAIGGDQGFDQANKAI